ncbi:MAG: OB-fold domain-containing protein, partial [Desulfosarcina sp.]
MIGYLEGRLMKKERDRILLLANQVGYEILVPVVV